jgi:radical SAM protein with 4Fe4S-binding SPASM domain
MPPLNNLVLLQAKNISQGPSFLGASLASPTIYTLELTTHCDNSCSGCANIDLVQRRDMAQAHLGFMTNWQEIIHCIEQQPGSSDFIIRLSGGEPTLHPQFAQIVALLEEKKFRHVLLSTGKWSKAGSDSVINLYASCHYSAGMLISLHGADKISHGSFIENKSNSFEITCLNIRKAASAGIRVYTNTVLTTKNWDQTSKIASLSAALGAECAVFNRFIGPGHPLQLTKDQLRVAIRTILNTNATETSCRIGNSIPKCFYPISTYPSTPGYELCHISPEGQVKPDSFSTFSFGNILEEPLLNLWHSANAIKYRRYLSLDCLDCAALSMCRGSQKSPYLLSKTHDPLITKSLSIEEVALIPDDPEKGKVEVRALTSE